MASQSVDSRLQVLDSSLKFLAALNSLRKFLQLVGQQEKGAEPSGQQSQQLGQQPGLVEGSGQHPLRVCQNSACSWFCWTPWTATCGFPGCWLARKIDGIRKGQQVEV
ncbi:hypothetical protein MA16_Dca016227 [Dendrobium catenatum]|uniref:Uncharacterized protein n=1 Tax=Dendrobium catenatum TaxID=906689 RepID=A0A2I0VVR7_9ASPA|nr:hypothetical protein MA16_Dca016227 [Dendrobium catenatum]